MNRFIRLALGIGLVMLIFVGGYAFGQSSVAPVQLFGPQTDAPESVREHFAPFWETWRLVQREFYDQPLDTDVLVEGAIDGLLATLDDPNTVYLPPAQEEAARRVSDGSFEGIGATVTTNEDDAIVIISPYEGSPARQAGLRPGDIIRAANGEPLTGKDVAKAAEIIRGPAGTTVTLLVERDGEQFEVDVVRGVIDIPSVRGERLEDDIGYIRLSRFIENTPQQLQETLEELMAERPVGLILDLRGNPGGGLDTAIDVAEQFLDSGPVLIQRFGDGRERVFRATDDGAAEEVPLVVLIDEGSASASEVLASAIRDRERGTLIGTTSFGKGTIQTWHELSNGGGVRITFARWLTPDGEWVHESGIQPDFTIEAPAEPLAEGPDRQLESAVNFLLGIPVTESSSQTAD
ncbi:MAG: S41 family peptidase [Candidatus Promineifilaceae bacterium]|nr:S41 family peptidase [Candidatus Promineifilaceae bacterium]